MDRGGLAYLATMAIAMAGCGGSDSSAIGATQATQQVQCDAAFFQGLRGEPIEIVDNLTTPLNVRVLGPEDFVPRDFDPNRLTFTTTPEGTVSRVFCG